MASTNPNFIPNMSTNEIFRNLDIERCLTDDLDTIEANISDLQSGKANASHTHSQNDISGLSDAITTAVNTKADLVDGKVPAAQLPSYVDDVVEYISADNFPTEGEYGKIYVAIDTNKVYRYTGSIYVEISQGVNLGETSASAYRGDRGKIAYEHSLDDSIHVTSSQKTAWNNKAEASHTHSENDITGLTSTLNNCFPTSGGTITGNVNVEGIVRVNGKQMIYDSGTMSTFGTNNQATMIAGSQVYSKTAITVSSDERLKTDVMSQDIVKLWKFIKDLDVVSFKYKFDEAVTPPHIGVIAQEMQEVDKDIAKYLLSTDSNGYLGVKSADLVYPLIGAVQYLTCTIAHLNSVVEKLTAEVDEMKDK